jgi:mono/diheme cytochrome c family protein
VNPGPPSTKIRVNESFGEEIMEVRPIVLGLAGALAFLATANAQQPQAPNPGREAVMSKCFQCHTDAMFRDARQDRRSWEAAIYRMIGRGGLYTQEEIKLMADYLGTEFGPDAKPAAPAK